MFPWYLWFTWRDLWSFPFCCFPLFGDSNTKELYLSGTKQGHWSCRSDVYQMVSPCFASIVTSRNCFVNDGNDCATHCSWVYVTFDFTIKQRILFLITSGTLKFNSIMRDSTMNLGDKLLWHTSWASGTICQSLCVSMDLSNLFFRNKFFS